MYYYVSLGRHCTVAYNIKKYINENIPTQFFDWVRTDFKCALHILNLRCLDAIFNIDNLIVEKPNGIQKDISITLKNFEEKELTLLFHHDIPVNDYSDIEINNKLIEFIDKYKRRHDRLIELIKSNNNKLCFLYYIASDFDYVNDIELFNKIIYKINKDVAYLLVLLVNDESADYYYTKYNNYLLINLPRFTDKNIESGDFHFNVDWKTIFKIIENTDL